MVQKNSKKVGMFICWCGHNIAGTVDVKKVVEEISRYPDVEVSKDYVYLCSEPGQKLISDAIKEKKLDAVVCACCSPTLHENTFRRVAVAAGMNPYQCEIANVREQCSWVTDDKAEATSKATRIVKSIIEKVKSNESLDPIRVPVTRRALVVGGGIAGIQAALDISNAGYEVYLVEKDSSIGGHMAQLSETFPTLDCSQCILTPKMSEVRQNPLIKLLTYSEIVETTGYVGNFKVKIKKKAAYVDHEKCNGCGVCYEKCPIKVDSEFDEGLAKRKAIYVPFPQAVPNKPVIDKEHCTYFVKSGKCRVCEIVCPPKAVDFKQTDEIIEVDFGAIVVATGFDLYKKEAIGEYGYGRYKDVINGLQFERILSASGPTGGVVQRPSDGTTPKRVAFIQCAGSRDTEHGVPYCSKICCMYATKHAMLYRHLVHDGEAIIFYIDVRTGGKGYEEFYKRATDDGVVYIRGKVSKVYEEDGKVIVLGVDTLSGRKVEVAVDLVVLAVPTVPTTESEAISKIFKLGRDEHGFFNEAHPKLRPVETLSSGFFLAGAAQGPKDIPEVVAQASAAASKVLALFSQPELQHEPTVAGVNEDLCSGCGLCVAVCPYNARELDRENKKVKVTVALCEGCGCCSVACPAGAAQQKNLTDQQVMDMVETVLK